jgi:hypothetical protein
MPAGAMPADGVERLQRLERENLQRSTTATAALRRLLADLAAAGSRPEQFPAELARTEQDQAVRAYQRLTEAAVRFISRAMQLALDHRDDYLRGLLAPGHVPASSPPPVPLPSGGYDPAWWVGWYQLLARWVTEQQARSAMLYRALSDEAAAGRLPQDHVQSSAQAFLETRLEGYFLEMARLNAELVSEILDVTDASVEALMAAVAAHVVLDVSGPAASTVTAALLIENAHNDAASVTCLAVPVGAFGLIIAPAAMRLEAGESGRLAVHVALPPVPTPGPSLAGWITIRGHGETDLRAEVRAQVGHPLSTAS